MHFHERQSMRRQFIYRPTYTLPAFGKILYKRVFDQIYHHFTKNKLFTARHFEFASKCLLKAIFYIYQTTYWEILTEVITLRRHS